MILRIALASSLFFLAACTGERFTWSIGGQDQVAASENIQIQVPKGWGVEINEKSVPREMVTLLPSGKIAVWLSLLFGRNLPLSELSISRFPPEKYIPLEERLKAAEKEGDKHWPSRTTTDLKIEKIGNYNWFIRVADEELLDGSVAIQWVGITNVGKTPYIVMASYPKEKAQSLGAQMLGLLSTIKLKE